MGSHNFVESKLKHRMWDVFSGLEVKELMEANVDFRLMEEEYLLNWRKTDSLVDMQKHPNAGIFARRAGPDGTSIWAAATSGDGALAIHLLACMLARVWQGHKAISIWVEIVERRKQQIPDEFQATNMASTAAVLAAKQTFSRQQLTAWDASARS